MFDVHCDLSDNSLHSVSHLSHTTEDDRTLVELLLGEVRVADGEVGCEKEVPGRVLVDGDVKILLFFDEQWSCSEGETERIRFRLCKGRRRGIGVVRRRIEPKRRDQLWGVARLTGEKVLQLALSFLQQRCALLHVSRRTPGILGLNTHDAVQGVKHKAGRATRRQGSPGGPRLGLTERRGAVTADIEPRLLREGDGEAQLLLWFGPGVIQRATVGGVAGKGKVGDDRRLYFASGYERGEVGGVGEDVKVDELGEEDEKEKERIGAADWRREILWEGGGGEGGGGGSSTNERELLQVITIKRGWTGT